MRLTTLVVGVLCCALTVVAQAPANDDYYDYYDEAPLAADTDVTKDADTASAKKPASKQKNDPEIAVEEEIATEAITEKSTTPAPSNGRRKAFNLRSNLNRSRNRPSPDAPRRKLPPSIPTPPPVTRAPNPRKNNSRRRPSQSKANTADVAEEEKAQPSRSSRRNQSRSNRPSATRGSNTGNNEETEKPVSTNRARNSRRGSRRQSNNQSSQTVTEAPLEESAPHRFSRVRGNSGRQSSASETEENDAAGSENQRGSRFGNRSRG